MPQYTPDRFTIGNLLSTTNPPIRVPDWQRNYSWTSSEVDTFWKDLVNFDGRYPGNNLDGQEYFVGSVVLVDNNAWHLLLDGQQRLATSAILLSVIRDFLAPYDQNAASRTSNKFLIDFDDATQTSIDKITLNRYDQDFFRREILEVRGANYRAPIIQIESHQLIRKARQYFESRFETKREELNDPRAFKNWMLRIQRVLTQHVSVVGIVSQDENNAALVFETLNDRGIGLSTPDLLRNLVMRRAHENELEEIASLWGEVLESETDVKLRIFLRHYWISHRGDIKTQSLYREIRDHILQNNVESLAFSRELRDSSLVYRDIVNAQHDNADVNQHLAALGELGASVMYPLALSALETIQDVNELDRFFRACVVAYVRHNVVARLESSLLEDAVFGLARTLRENGDTNAALQTLRDTVPNDATFVEAFRTAAISNRAAARYVLRTIELTRRRTEELEVALPPKVHVEHIYPQTPPEAQRWPEHSRVLNRLGNLTLLSRRLNAAIRNGVFDAKRAAYVQSELLITQELQNFDQWSPTTIDQRQTALAEHAAQIWPFPV